MTQTMAANAVMDQSVSNSKNVDSFLPWPLTSDNFDFPGSSGADIYGSSNYIPTREESTAARKRPLRGCA
jgi:hypothetical protein